MSDEPTRDVRAPAWSLDQTDVLAPTRVLAGKYRLGRLLGEGGMGAVYEAEHIELGVNVAVKLLSDHYATNPTAAKRVRREARAMAAIRHDNIVAVTDTGSDNGTPYIVMELLEGESLNALLKRQGKLKPSLAAAVLLQVLDGVAAAHEQGVIHRDLKPGNVFLTRGSAGNPRVKILDFGVSKVATDTEETTLTVTGAAVGTPLYMAPEQLRGDPDIDGRADIYALGVMLYRMVTGKLPGADISPPERRAAILQGKLPPPRKVAPDLAEELEQVITTAMSVERDERYADAQTFRAAVVEAIPEATTALSPPSQTRATATVAAPPRSRRGPALAAAAGVLVAAALFAAFWASGWFGSDEGGNEPARSQKAVGPTVTRPPLRLGMTTYTNRKEQERIYGPIARYLGEQLDRPVELAIFPDAKELGRRFLSDEVEIAALPPGSYVRLHDAQPGIELLATTVTAGGSSFQVLIVTRADTGIEKLTGLRGKTFCYVPSADSGWLIPRDMLRRAGLDPDHAFGNTRLVDNHLAALRHVANGRCDATAVYAGLYYKLGDQEGSDLSPGEFSILEHSERIPNDAYCANDNLPDQTIARLREALLGLSPHSKAAEGVFSEGGELVGFAPTTDDAYERVRQAMARERDGSKGD